jgi:hypothetical protein
MPPDVGVAEGDFLAGPCILAAPTVVTHGDVHKYLAAAGIKAHHQSFLFFIAFFA